MLGRNTEKKSLRKTLNFYGWSKYHITVNSSTVLRKEKTIQQKCTQGVTESSVTKRRLKFQSARQRQSGYVFTGRKTILHGLLNWSEIF